MIVMVMEGDTTHVSYCRSSSTSTSSTCTSTTTPAGSMDEDSLLEFWLYPSAEHEQSPEDTLAKVFSLVAPSTRWVGGS